MLQSHPPVTEIQSGKSLKVLSEVLSRVLREIGVLGGGAPESAQGNRGAPGGALERAQCGVSTGRALSGALPEALPVSLSTLGSTPRSTPISRSTPGSTSESTFKDFPL